MYAIGYVIYGAPITDAVEKVAEDRDEELDEEDGGFFTTFYNGGGSHTSGYIGIELASFDECTNIVFNDINKKPTDRQEGTVFKQIQGLPEDYRKVLPEIKRWIVWGTS